MTQESFIIGELFPFIIVDRGSLPLCFRSVVMQEFKQTHRSAVERERGSLRG